MLLGKRIRHFRLASGLTLEALGAQVGVVASQLSLIENGKREPRLSLLQAIAAALEIDPAELLRQEPPNRRSALELELRACATLTQLPAIAFATYPRTQILE